MPNRIAVVGLGYVGLPLAVAFGKAGHQVTGYDLQKEKLEQLSRFDDRMGEVSPEDLKAAKIDYTDDATKLSGQEFIVVAVPTPVDSSRRPNLKPIEGASRAIAPHVSDGVVVIYESTVYPGVTEEVCLPILLEAGKEQGKDFRIGYSPERINPGDKEHTIDKIIKVVSAQDSDTLDLVAGLYETIVTVGVHRAESIKVAEAAKVIENTQRDLNIALMNELSIIFDKMGIRTRDVLTAAGTKWNFLRFYPGLVGGHCIGVDPYYLTHRAEALGYTPQVITAGRRINDGMAKVVAEKTVKYLISEGVVIRGARVLVLGTTFKEDVPDFRNSKVVNVIEELRDYQVEVHAHDPHVPEGEKLPEVDTPCASPGDGNYDAVILAVGHKEYQGWSLEKVRGLFSGNHAPILIDIMAKAQEWSDGLGSEALYWQL
jgi:UDP-N-acetyl-D-glucosamine/UDP-N-acetyl-D-galactosamine dehydrogenase